MKYAVVFLIIAASICGFGYLGIWVCFVGGIVQIIEAVKTDPIPSIEIAIGAVRILCTGACCWIGIMVCAFAASLGFALVEHN